MSLQQPRLVREQKTIAAMIRLYCLDRHGFKVGLCQDCQGMLDYATERLARCPYQGDKPTCVKCPVHCYKPNLRSKIREIMRYSGPRMLVKHPLLAAMHIIDGLRQKPARQLRKDGSGKGSSE